jgi:hypothetical protein
MQTFLPYADFDKSVHCLDRQRLGKQRVEAMQILNTLASGSRWANHPAVLMWRGYENALRLYMNKCIQEWIRRGYNNTMQIVEVTEPVEMPPWFGNEEFHASHRSNLLRKDAEWYGQFGWGETDQLPYVWPVRKS